MIFIKTISFLTFLLYMFIYISHDNIFDEEIYSFSRLSQDEGARLRSEIQLLHHTFDKFMHRL